MPTLELKPTHKAVVAYYEALAKFDKLGVKHEGAVASAFEDLLDHCARLTGRVLIPKYSLKRKGAKPIIPDAAVVDSLSQVLRYGRKVFSVIAAENITDLNFYADPAQCFPLFTYSEDGCERHDNITSKALVHFQNHYEDDAITRADIFHYVYALLHHPDYRARYAENLKRELPRIPLVGKAVEFHAFAKAGKKLAELHVNYEQQKEYPLKRVENREVKLDWRVEAMKLSKDHATLFYNDFLTLTGIPPETFEYRLGNRSALEWVIDQYRVTKDEHGHITSDPNRKDDEEYIVRLLGQVITVSVETEKIVKGLPKLN